MYHCGMRQVGERHVPYKVDLMVWSNRLDLLALSNFKGDIQVHRLHWQKVWNLPPPKENVSVRAMAWRPDGKALAVGYSSGALYIVDIEDREVLNKYELQVEPPDEFDAIKANITYITWAIRTYTLESAVEYNLYNDASIFLQRPPAQCSYKSQADDNYKDYKEIQEPTHLNMLLVGYGSGYIYMNIFGRYPYGSIHLTQAAKDDFGEYKILDIHMSDDFSIMQVLYVDTATNNVFVCVINTSVLSAYAEEIFIVANKHGHVTQLMTHVEQTMTSITEAWEHILLEMDTKMSNYASTVAEGGVSADLLELLLLGPASDTLQTRLLDKLTANDLKKFGNSIEMSYSTIQKLVLKQLNIVGQSLTYYLAEIRGLSRIPDRYKILDLEENTVTAAIKACCAFLNKCLELQQVIDVSMRNYKSFFRWLFVVIVRLIDEQTPSDIVKITQQEITHIADFLYNFDNVQAGTGDGNPDKPAKFNLERLGQYLQDQDLTIFPDDDDNPWHMFLNENACILKDSETIFSMLEFRNFSLLQQQKYLKKAIDKIFDIRQKDPRKYFSDLYNIRCYEDRVSTNILEQIRVSQMYDIINKRFMMAMITRNRNDTIYFLSIKIQERSCDATAVKYYFSPELIQRSGAGSNKDYLEIQDIQFYSYEYLSVLVQHPTCADDSVFIQLPLKIALDQSVELNVKSKSTVFTDKTCKKNISPLLNHNIYKVLEKIDGTRIAVSGGRKVSVVLSKSLRKVRVFEMEVDGEDDDETLDTTPLSQGTNDQDTPEKSTSHSLSCGKVSF